MLSKENIQEIYPLSPAQESMLFHSLLDPDSPVYFNQISYTIKGELRLEYVRKSLQQLFDRHAILRTVFVYRTTERPFQVVLKKRSIECQFEILTGIENKDEYVNEFKKKDRAKTFDLSTDILMRVHILQLEEQLFEFIWSYHHILMDGWSTRLLFDEYDQLYKGDLNNRKVMLPEVHPFKSYIAWLGNREKERAALFWSTYLSGSSAKSSILPSSKIVLPQAGYRGNSYLDKLNIDLPDRLRQFSSVHGVTSNTILQTIWGILLSKYTRQMDVVFGSVVSGRPPELKGSSTMIGLFINTIPVRVSYDETTLFSQLARSVQQNSIDAIPHHYYPLAEIQSASPERQLFNTIFVFENYPKPAHSSASVTLDATYLISNTESFTQTNFPLNMVITPSESFQIAILYDENLFGPGFIHDLFRSFQEMIQQVLYDPDIPVTRISLASVEDQTLFLSRHYDTASFYPADKPIQALFEEQVSRTSRAQALFSGAVRLSYGELNDKANIIAHYLRARLDIAPDDKIGIMADRSALTIIGILAILKAGAAYVPIDPGAPEERTLFMAEEAALKALLSSKEIATGTNSHFGKPVIRLDDESLFQGMPSSNPPILNGSRDLAYVMYTSGTSGKPKGVMIEHRSVIRLVFNTNYIRITAEDALLQTGSLCFDAATFEIWGMLLHGGLLHLLPFEQLLQADEMKKELSGHHISLMWLTSSWFNQLVDSGLEMFGHLHTLIIGGEKLSVPHVNKVIVTHPGLTLINGYGPTENTTFSTCFKISGPCYDSIPIGHPISNSTAYIVDDKLRPLPIGAIGEIALGGHGLARGYIDNPELNAQNFVEHPFGKNEKLYLTGDLAKWLEDGNIEFLGRKDNQFKFRGFRIEPEEIEKMLGRHPAIRDVSVKLMQGNTREESRLVVFFTAGETMSGEDLKKFLQVSLPEYMIPSHFQQLDKLPLNANGKIDQVALANLVQVGETAIPYSPPVTFMQKILVNVWEKVLDKHPIGIHDNFFGLGGHSLKATRIISRLYQDFNLKVQMKDLFAAPSIELLAEIIPLTGAEVPSRINKTKEDLLYPLSPSQKRLWLLDQLEKEQVAYNITRSYILTGNLNSMALKEAFDTLVRRHEILRTVFVVVDGVPMQKVLPRELSGFEFRYSDHTGHIGEMALISRIAEEETNHIFHLEKGPLFRVRLEQLERDRFLFIMSMHHIISDGWSLKVILDEIDKLYEAFHKKQPDPLKELNIQYKDYTVWYNRLLEGDNMNSSRQYWLRKLEQPLPPSAMPTDHRRPHLKRYNGSSVSYSLDPSCIKKLAGIAHAGKATPYMILVAAIKSLLYQYSGHTDIIIGSPVAGRDHKSLETQIGFYVNTLAVRTRFDENESFVSLLQKVRKTILEAFEHQHYPFEQLIQDLNIPRDTSRSPLFDIMVNFLNLDIQTPSAGAISALGDLLVEEIAVDGKGAQFDLSFDFNQEGEGLYCRIEYNTDLFKKTTIDILKERLIRLIHSIAENPNCLIRDLDASIPTSNPFSHLKPTFDFE
ncbi:MAG TPA: amino acid adenylation domain-containing protein [Puia sp.]|nr:amino acid adenylation domain-containing protein [Puia sp.]